MNLPRTRTGDAFAITLIAFLLSSCGGQDAEQPVSVVGAASQSIAADDPKTYVFINASEIASAEHALLEESIKRDTAIGSNFHKMVKDLGGFDAFNALIATNDHSRIAATVSRYGIGYSTSAPNDAGGTARALATTEGIGNSDNPVVRPLNIDDCIPFYPVPDRNKTFVFGPHNVYIDTLGRPGYATWRGTAGAAIAAGVRNPTCQLKVGRMGLTGDDGGHMIPAALGGWGGRANMIPQNAEFNRGPWRNVESVPAICAKTQTTTYTFTPFYALLSDVRPARLNVTISILWGGFFPLTAGMINSPNAFPSPQTTDATQSFKTAATQFCS